MKVFAYLNAAAMLMAVCGPLAGDCYETVYSHLDLRHRDPRGVGYDEGYTTGDLFVGFQFCDDWLVILNPRGHIFNDGRFAGNIGLGARFGFCNWVFGANAYYDYRKMPKDLKDCFDFSFQQVGVGLEALGCVDVRVNGYIPVGKRASVVGPYFSHLSGNSAFFKTKGVTSVPAIYGEVGLPFECLCPAARFYFAAGPYYLFDRDFHPFSVRDAVGVKARAEMRIWDYLTLEGSVTHDRNYNTRLQGVIQLRLPLGGGINVDCCYTDTRCTACYPNLLSPIVREEIIPIKAKRKKGVIQGEQPCKIVFVDNSVAGVGLGTFESPYRSLKDAENNSAKNDILYLAKGDGSNRFQNMGIELQPGQKLIGTGQSFEMGGFVIPAQDPGTRPRITNSFEGPVVLLSKRNEVAGIFIEADDLGVTNGGANGLGTLLIRDSIITATDNQAIELTLTGSSQASIVNSIIGSEDTTSSAISITASDNSRFDFIGNIAESINQNALELDLSQSSAYLADNVFVSEESSASSIMVNSDASGTHLENNLFFDPFILKAIGSESSALTAIKNESRVSGVSTYRILNTSSSPLFVKTPVPPGEDSFEKVNEGTIETLGDVEYIPLD